MPRLTQNQRVARLLVQRGRAGITQIDCDAPTDGGKPVRRLSSRVNDLRHAGYSIVTRREANGLARYVLTASPGARSESPETACAAVRVEPLEGVGSSTTRSPYDPWEGAA